MTSRLILFAGMVLACGVWIIGVQRCQRERVHGRRIRLNAVSG